MAPPKKTNLEKTIETLQRDVGKIISLEKSINEMKKQMGKLGVLERLEQRMIKEEEAKKQRSLASSSVVEKSDHVGTSGEIVAPLTTVLIEASPIVVIGEKTELELAQPRQPKPPEETREPKGWNEPLTWRIEISLFDSDEAKSWILRVEQYFELESFTEEEKLQAVSMCFNGEALLWYRWSEIETHFWVGSIYEN